MGYSGLKTWGECDDNGAHFIHKDINKALKSTLRDKGNEFNPSGAVKVGLLNEAFVLPIAKQLSHADFVYEKDGTESIVPVLKRAVEGLEDELELLNNGTNDDWGGRSNREMHRRAYMRILKNLRTSIRIISNYADTWVARAARRYMARAAKLRESKKKKKS